MQPYSRDYKDIIGGALLTVFGLWLTWQTLQTLRIGTLGAAGPGMMPLAVGVILSVFGLIILVPAFFRRGDGIHVEWRPLITLTAAAIAFGITIRWFGLIPATVVLVLIACLTETRLRPVTILAMIILLPLAAYLIFPLALSLPLPLLWWPF